MELRNKKLNYLLSTICKENEDFANTLQEAESNMSNKLIRLIEDCKTFEIETPDYIACLKINRAFNLWVKFKDTNRDLFLLIESINKQMLESAGKRNIAVMAYNVEDKDAVYNCALIKSDDKVILESTKTIESVETGELYEEPKVTTSEILDTNLLNI